MLPKDVLDYYGTWSRLIREVGLGLSTYQGWLKKGYIPYRSQLLIEKSTKTKLLANVEHGRPQS